MPLKDPEARRRYQEAYRMRRANEIRATQRAHYLAHKAEIRAKQHAYYHAHADELCAASRAYRLAHLDERRAYHHEYYEKNKAYILAQQSDYSAAYRAECQARVRKSRAKLRRIVKRIRATLKCAGPGPHKGRLEFHNPSHRQHPNQRIALLTHRTTLGAIVEEMERSVPLCVACHRRADAEERRRRRILGNVS